VSEMELSPPLVPNCNKFAVVPLMNGMRNASRIFSREVMAVVGLTLNRLRSAFTVITRESLSSIHSTETPLIGKPQFVTRLVQHGRRDIDDDSNRILDSVSATIESLNLDSGASKVAEFRLGILAPPPSDWSDSDIEFFKFHTIVSHQLRQRFRTKVSEIPIGAIRFNLGISSSKSCDSKKKLIDMFKSSSVDHDNASTTSGYQTMAESWGVARVLDKKRVLNEVYERNPLLIDRIRSEVSKKKIFRDSSNLKTDILSELVDSQIETILSKRLGL